ncbi:MAG: hypothetical protein KTR29_17720 [Rhodothermaceae bacterium]|nr:hypothetical protein [Rhodothermaceae bacterium]
MKTNILLLTLIFITTGCASTLVQNSDTQYAVNQFDMALLEEGGIGMLPVRGVERVSRTVLTAAADSFFYFTPTAIDYVDSKMLARVISSNDLAEDYIAFSEGLDATGLVNPKVLKALQELTGHRYYVRIFTDRLAQKTRVGLERNIITGKTEVVAYDSKAIKVYGQVLDALSGEIVWEGTGFAGASESRYTYIAQTETQFYAAATETLLRGILGIPPTDRQSLPAQYGRVVEKTERLPDYEFEYRGFVFNVQECPGQRGPCRYAEVYQPVELQEEAYLSGLLFWGQYDTLDSRFVKKSTESRIDKFLDQLTPPEEPTEEAGPQVATLTDIPCATPQQEAGPRMVATSNQTPIYEKRRTSSTVLAYVDFGTDVIAMQTKGKYVQVCFEDGSGWIESANLGRTER